MSLRPQSLKAIAASKAAAEAAMEQRRRTIVGRTGAMVRRVGVSTPSSTPLSIPKVEVPSWKSQTLRDLARDEPCYFETPWCNHDRATTVLIHSDSLEDGNGQGCKPNDLVGAAPGCSECHRWFGECKQGTDDERRAVFLRANRRWLVRLTQLGLIDVKRRA